MVKLAGIGPVIGLFIVLTSGIVPLVVSRYRHLQTATNYHISAMCISDCGVGIMIVSYAIIRAAWPAVGYSPGMCMAVVYTSRPWLTA